MCGFTGFLVSDAQELYSLEEIVNRMSLAIDHRGPDDEGTWVDVKTGIALAHRRLSIVDLSVTGHQPMISNSGRFVLAFNGEIYNHLDLRQELEQSFFTGSFQKAEKLRWTGHSDTETLLAGFEVWGIEETLRKSVGMFAISLWDVKTRTLHLSRDRLGEKPLYYGWVGRNGAEAFVFGSELKAIRAYPGFDNPISRKSLALYMRFTYVPAPHSIYQNIFKLEPGCILSISGAIPIAPITLLRPPIKHEGLVLRRWWSLSDVVSTGSERPITGDVEAVDSLEQCIKEAIRLQSRAEVPLGAFLSGGVDSSTIVALMQKQSNRAVKTFTVGFEEADFDESTHARAVAQHLGTEHVELYVTAVEAQSVIPKLPSMYDEPFADSSQIPTYLVCEAARKKVTVALSGDAGDELFGGYNRYFWGDRIWNRFSWLPYPARQTLGKVIRLVSVEGWNQLVNPINALLSNENRISKAGDKAHKLAARLRDVSNLDDLYLSLISEWNDPASVVRGHENVKVTESLSLLYDPLPEVGMASESNSQLRMMYRDTTTYLPDDILCKVDRAAMSVSLETRVPFLDHRVVEMAWRLPLNMKIRGGESKWALRQVLYRHVPRELIDRPKLGFGVPVGQWLRGPLQEWAENLLEESRLLREGYFYPEQIRRKWSEHVCGIRDHTVSLWTVLMFQAWLENQTNQIRIQ